MDHKDYYQRLCLPSDASDQQIKDAYRKEAFRYHPDRNEGDPAAAETMKGINEAYAVLSDRAKRQQYDALRRQYGNEAHAHFRQTYSNQDIFRNSDVQQLFEEMAKAFGLRGFDDIFNQTGDGGHHSFTFRHPKGYAKGFFYSTGFGRKPRAGIAGKNNPAIGRLSQKVLQKLLGIQVPVQGGDIHDIIRLKPEFALLGGPFAYRHSALNKKLVVQIPKGVRDGQIIRLVGMGYPGKGGGPQGDLLIKVRFVVPLWEKLKGALTWKPK